MSYFVLQAPIPGQDPFGLVQPPVSVHVPATTTVHVPATTTAAPPPPAHGCRVANDPLDLSGGGRAGRHQPPAVPVSVSSGSGFQPWPQVGFYLCVLLCAY